MDEQEKYQLLQGLTAQLAQNLECLRDALTDLSLSLKDSEMQLNPELAQAAAAMAEEALHKCAQYTPEPPAPNNRR